MIMQGEGFCVNTPTLKTREGNYVLQHELLINKQHAYLFPVHKAFHEAAGVGSLQPHGWTALPILQKRKLRLGGSLPGRPVPWSRVMAQEQNLVSLLSGSL